MRDRKWVYVMPPYRYSILCDKCGSVNIAWSEFEHKIWCYECKIDTDGNGGIFDGPIPVRPPLCKIRSIMKKLYEKFIRRISRMFWNHTVHSIILEAMKKNIINSHQSHAILGAWNANCFPERGYRSFLHEGGRTPRALDKSQHRL